MGVFDEEENRHLGDIFVRQYDPALYELISIIPLKFGKVVDIPSSYNVEDMKEIADKEIADIKTENMFNLTHFIKNFKEYLKLKIEDEDEKDIDDYSLSEIIMKLKTIEEKNAKKKKIPQTHTKWGIGGMHQLLLTIHI